MTRQVLHVISDETLQQRFTHEELAQMITSAGADFIQYREKRPCDTKTLVATAQTLQNICLQSTSTRLIVNDRVDVAYSVKSHGVHLGEKDLPVETAQSILGSTSVIGGTFNDPKCFSPSWASQFHYLGVGPVYGTTSKTNPAPPLGLDRLADLCHASPVDVIAIGNIRLSNIDKVLATGVAGVAVLAAIVCAPDPAEQTHKFMQALRA